MSIMALPAPIVPLAEVALIDENAELLGQRIGGLMEQAGLALAHEAGDMAPDGPILIATGSGNNGGDGWVCARHLAAAGREVLVWPVQAPRSPLCQAAAERAHGMVERIDEAPDRTPALIVDAILGAGAKGPPRGRVLEAVSQLSRLAQAGCTILAADAPTGIGSAHLLPADRSICFQLAKAELLADPRNGEFKTVDIGIDSRAWTRVQTNCLRRFPLHRRTAHKGKHGELVVIGGGPFPGALELSCRASLLTGIDLIHAWTSEGPPLPASIIPHRQIGPTLAPSDPDSLTALLIRADALLIGPGLGRQPGGPEAAQQAFALAQSLGLPTVIDADGVYALSRLLRELPESDVPIIITPHRREAQTLLGRTPDDASLHAFARPDRVILRKGPVDLITNGRRWQENHRGNPRMTVGGTGDCLAGLCAGLLARGVGPFDAARMAVYLLTAAADECWLELGPCYTPEDILVRLPHQLRQDLGTLGLWPPVDDAA